MKPRSSPFTLRAMLALGVTALIVTGVIVVRPGARADDVADRANRPAADAQDPRASTTQRASGEGARASRVPLDRLLVPAAAPDGYVLNPDVTGEVPIALAATYLFGEEQERAWLERARFQEAYERTFVERTAPYRIIATTVYRFGDRRAPARLEHIPNPGERVFAVADFGGYATHGTDATGPTSARLGREVPDFVVRMDLADHLFFVEVAGPGTTARDAIELARRQYRRARALLATVR